MINCSSCEATIGRLDNGFFSTWTTTWTTPLHSCCYHTLLVQPVLEEGLYSVRFGWAIGLGEQCVSLEYHQWESSGAYLLCKSTRLLTYRTQIEYWTPKPPSPLIFLAPTAPVRLSVRPAIHPPLTRGWRFSTLKSSRMWIFDIAKLQARQRPICLVFTAPGRPLASLTAAHKQLYAPTSKYL
jgi:hypothetical protein